MFIMLAFAVKVRRKKPLLDFLGFREVTIPVLAAFLTGMTDSRWLFESTGHFLNSAILTVIPLVQKIPGKSKALRDQLAIL